MKSLKTIVASFILIANISYSQENDKRFCFEPIFGTFIPKIKFNTTNNISIINKENYGYKFGFLKNVGIGQVFVIRPTVAVIGFKRETYLTDLTDNNTPTSFNNGLDVHTQASLHISQNFTTGRARTFLYLVQGATLDYNLTNKEFTQDLWLEDNQNLTIDLGIGTRFYANRKHILAMEVLYSFGVLNLTNTSVNINATKFTTSQSQYYGNQVDKIKMHYVTLQFLL